MIVSTREAEQLFDEGADFSRQASATDSSRKFGAEDVAAQGVAAIGMGRTPIGVVPRRQAAIAKFAVGTVPSPEFHQRVNPEIQMVDGQVAPDVSHLLLARAPNFLHVVEVLLDGGAVGYSFDNLHGRGVRIGREEGKPIVILQDDHDANHPTNRAVRRQEGLVNLGNRFAVDGALGRFPAVAMGGALGEVEPVLAILLRSAATTASAAAQFSRQVAQRRVFAQTSNDRYPGAQGTFQEGSLHIAAVYDDPQRFPRLFDDGSDPLDQTRGQYELGGERPSPPLRNLGHRFAADVEHGPQRQRQSAEARMPHGQREGHPDMSVEIFLVGRSRRGVAVDVGPFYLWTVSLGGRVVDDRQNPTGKRQGTKRQNQQLRGNRFDLASKCRQEVIIVLEVVADSGGPKPSSYGSSPVGEKDAHKQDRQSPAVACMQPRRQPQAPLGPIFRTLPTTYRICHPWLSCLLRPGKRTVTEEPFS
jgi:hypothetical protein